jgi:hypothetical protein
MIGPLPVDLSRGRDWDVQFTFTALSVRPKARSHQQQEQPLAGDARDDNSKNWDYSVVGTLAERIVPSESTWTIEAASSGGRSGGSVLIVVLYKTVKTWWKSILVGDPEIDTSLVDSRRHIDEYDAETQGVLRKIMFDESQLRRGLPTSDEILGKAVVPPLPPPDLPPGVEYIDRMVLDEDAVGRKGGDRS